MNLLYIAGPYRQYTDIKGVVHSRAENVLHATAALDRLLSMGYSVICPHKNTEGMENYCSDPGRYLIADMEQIRRCDGLYMLKHWEKSNGAKAEYHFALSLQKVVFIEGIMEPDDPSTLFSDWRVKPTHTPTIAKNPMRTPVAWP